MLNIDYSVPIFGALLSPLLACACALALFYLQKKKNIRGKSANGQIVFVFFACASLSWLFLYGRLYGTEPLHYIPGRGVIAGVSLGEYKTFAQLLLVLDSYSLFASLLLSMLAWVPLCTRWESFFLLKRAKLLAVYYSLLLFSLFSIVVVSDLVTLYLCFELAFFALYFIATQRERGGDLRKEALQQFVTFSVALVFFMLGVALLYARYESTNMLLLSSALSFGVHEKVAFALMLLPLLLFIGIPPLHLWYQDLLGIPGHVVYKHSVVLFSTAAYFVLGRLLFSLYGGLFSTGFFSGVLIVLAALSLLCLCRNSLRIKDVTHILCGVTVSQKVLAVLALSVAAFSLKSPFAMAQSGYSALMASTLLIASSPFLTMLLFIVPNQFYSCLHCFPEGRLPSYFLCVLGGTIWVLVGLPPFVGYTGRLLLAQSAFAVNPFLGALPIFLLLLQLIALIYFFLRRNRSEPEVFRGGALAYSHGKPQRIALFALLLVFVYTFLVSFASSPRIITTLSPAMEALINKGDYRLTVLEEEAP